MHRNEMLCFQVVTMTDEAFFKKMGKRISAARKQANLTQAQLAELLGVKQQVVASYEVGRRRVPASCLPRLSEALGVSVEELLGLGGRDGKRGPAPKIQRQLEQIRRLPKSEQHFVSKLLENVIEKAHA